MPLHVFYIYSLLVRRLQPLLVLHFHTCRTRGLRILAANHQLRFHHLRLLAPVARLSARACIITPTALWCLGAQAAKSAAAKQAAAGGGAGSDRCCRRCGERECDGCCFPHKKHGNLCTECKGAMAHKTRHMNTTDRTAFVAKWDKTCTTEKGKSQWKAEVKDPFVQLKRDNGGRLPRQKLEVLSFN